VLAKRFSQSWKTISRLPGDAPAHYQGVATFLQGAIGGNQEEVGSRVSRPHITSPKLGHEVTSWLGLRWRVEFHPIGAVTRLTAGQVTAVLMPRSLFGKVSSWNRSASKIAGTCYASGILY
jgi:hypothetical protein